MGNCCAPSKDKGRSGGNPGIVEKKVDMDILANVIMRRSKDLTRFVMESPMNNKNLPDFMEKRILESVITMIFTIVLSILIPEQYTSHSSEPEDTTNEDIPPTQPKNFL